MPRRRRRLQDWGRRHGGPHQPPDIDLDPWLDLDIERTYDDIATEGRDGTAEGGRPAARAQAVTRSAAWNCPARRSRSSATGAIKVKRAATTASSSVLPDSAHR